MTDIEVKQLIERLRQRSNSNYVLMSYPPKPAPDADCHMAADLLQEALAFKQEVSDAVEKVIESCAVTSWGAAMLDPLIIPKPKPDPLVEVLLDMELSHDQEQGQHDARYLRAKLEVRGLEIRPKEQ